MKSFAVLALLVALVAVALANTEVPEVPSDVEDKVPSDVQDKVAYNDVAKNPEGAGKVRRHADDIKLPEESLNTGENVPKVRRQAPSMPKQAKDGIKMIPGSDKVPTP